jgi:hypothetical protein
MIGSLWQLGTKVDAAIISLHICEIKPIFSSCGFSVADQINISSSVAAAPTSQASARSDPAETFRFP